MKLTVFLSVFFLWCTAFASEKIGGEAQESRFHLLNMKCESEVGDSIETSPQSPPLDVDDPGTPGCNKWEINILTSGDFTRGEQKYEIPLLDINYGIGDNLQLKYEVPMEKTQAENTSDSSVGDSKAGIKYMFFEDEGSKLQIAFYPQVSFSTPSVNKSHTMNDAATSGNIVTLPLLVSKKLAETIKGDVMFTGNVGYNVSSRADTESSVYFATGIGLPLFRNISIMGELSDEEAVAKNADGIRENLVKINLGMLGSLNKYIFLYGSLGESLVSSDHLSHTYAVVGARFLTGLNH